MIPDSAFLPAREDVKGTPAEAVREAAFASDRIPLAAEDHQIHVAPPAPVVMGALPPVAVKPAEPETERRASTLPKRVKQATPDEDVRCAALEAFMREHGTVYTSFIGAWFQYYEGNGAMLASDMAAIGAARKNASRNSPWRLRDMSDEPKAAPHPPDVDAIDVRTLPVAFLDACAQELVRRARQADKVRAALAE